MRIGFAMTLAVFAACACGDNTDGPAAGGSSSTGGASGAAAASGTSTTGGSNETAGAAGIGAKAGSDDGNAGSAHGGAGGQAPTAGANSGAGAPSCGGSTSGSGSLPKGDVDACFGEACPFGQCDNGSIAAPTRCDDVYSASICGGSMQCLSGASGAHCLTVITTVAVENWVVTCASGTPTASICTGGCGIVGGQAKCL